MKNYNDHKKVFYENGNLHIEHYLLNNKAHRTDGPAIIRYYYNGNLRSEYYSLNDIWHRTNGPALIWYYKNGNILQKCYYLNGELHRKGGGPCNIVYNKNGEVNLDRTF